MRRSARAAVVVTVDGPAASGKSSVARGLAAALRLPFLSTGALYRAAALEAGRRGVRWSDAAELARLTRSLRLDFGLDGRVRLRGRDVTAALNSPEIAAAASAHTASARPVREAVLAWSRRFAAARGAVAEGRDCGTVIFPGARHKIFLTASAAERARRRVADHAGDGRRLAVDGVRRAIERRDRLDAARPWGALAAAPDAWVVDTSGRTVAGTLAVVRRLIGR